VLMIGNKCFQLAAGFSHCYDLSRLWFELTGLPFVFALVLAHPQLPQGVLAEAGRLLQAAVTRGAQHLTEVVEDWMAEHPEEKPLKHKEYYHDYLQHKISYALTPEALAGLRTFYEKTALEFPARKRDRLTPAYFRRLDLAGTSVSAPPSGAEFRQKPR
jgi:predicted solute-binding protein